MVWLTAQCEPRPRAPTHPNPRAYPSGPRVPTQSPAGCYEPPSAMLKNAFQRRVSREQRRCSSLPSSADE